MDPNDRATIRDIKRNQFFRNITSWENLDSFLSNDLHLELRRLLSDIEGLKARNVNLQVLAERGVEIFFTQVFSHNFFHADMHPGNIFVDASDPDDVESCCSLL